MPGTPPSDPLPAPIQRELHQIATELNDMPRECARDHGELCQWKGRLARRIRGVMTMRVPARVLRLPAPVAVERPRPKKGGRKVVGARGRQLEMGL